MPTLRDRAVELLELATHGETGVVSTDPIYSEVTGGRDPGPGYSSCVDLPHWMLSQLTSAPWLEVDEGGSQPLRRFWSAPWRAPQGCEIPRAGDTWVIWATDANGIKSRTHALVVESLALETGELWSWDYGQSSVDPGRWYAGQVEGIRKRRKVECIDGVWTFDDGRKLRTVLTLDAALGRSAEDEAPATVAGQKSGSAWPWVAGALGVVGWMAWRNRR